ncbi:MAG: deoxyguanosinetriphosphate triphosphohydrolase [Eubacteriales bacterium]
MENLRLRQETIERQFLSPFACQSVQSKGRDIPVTLCDVRTAFQRDVDRIIHSKAFRRLKHKTQVFLLPENDYYRTRMTHTLEVSRIARTIARGLSLNEDLTEAIALGHDLGHTPFGHAGERILNERMPEGFRHNIHSGRVVTILENLNLTYEVKNGIVCHSGNTKAETLEGRVVAISDRIAYINHDIQDALRGKVIEEIDLPYEPIKILGRDHGPRINTLILDLIENSLGKDDIYQSTKVGDAMLELRAFMFEYVYTNPVAKSEEGKAQQMLSSMFTYYMENHEELPVEFQPQRAEESQIRRGVCDYLAGMSDSYAASEYMKIFVPEGWRKK